MIQCYGVQAHNCKLCFQNYLSNHCVSAQLKRCKLNAVLLSAEREKKLKYNEACELKHASFTPHCININGLLGNEMKHFLSRLANRLATKWDQTYKLHWIRAKLSFALTRATNLCIRGSRSKWRGLSMEDGFGINPLCL